MNIRFRRWWIKPELKEEIGLRFGAYSTIFLYFKLEDEEEFYNFVGMTLTQFNNLHNLVHNRLVKRSCRRSLSPELRLAAVLNAWKKCMTVQDTAETTEFNDNPELQVNTTESILADEEINISDEEYKIECLDEHRDILEHLLREQEHCKNLERIDNHQESIQQQIDQVNESLSQKDTDADNMQVFENYLQNQERNQKESEQESGQVLKSDVKNIGVTTKDIDMSFPKPSFQSKTNEDDKFIPNYLEELKQNLALHADAQVLEAKVSILADGIDALPENKKRLALRKIIRIIQECIVR
ncbi:hypothetical protein TSAR_014054 [Trichomalopsis sarcophagae]|uniref:Uncharacterized protein n=1 Tax=Trichomalopsis sarcophagae TaxID=543379 RepID=A0A232EJX6_9HYME|nr:hypothetical protein TSAR_014054 [Trichomalopsis sarcophagae]